jgi:DNA polymerase III alpha subunit
MSYIPVHVHTAWSLLDSVVTIDSLVAKSKEYGIPAICMTDHNNIKGVVPFFKECKASGIKPIIGVELDTYSGDNFVGRITLLAKNKTGYKNIVKLVSMARTKEALSFNGMPRTQVESLYPYKAGLICLVGDLKSQIYSSAFVNHEMAYSSDSVEECETLLHKDWKSRIEKVLENYKKIYENVFLFYDVSLLPAHFVLGKRISESFEEALPSHNIHYLNKEDIELHELLTKAKEDGGSCCEAMNDSRIFDKRWSRGYLSKELKRGEKTLKLLDLI